MHKDTVLHEFPLIEYQEAWDLQELLFNDIADTKLSDRKNNIQSFKPHQLIICEHPHVYTLGKSGNANHLLINEDFLHAKGATFVKINRGGDITYHGPGQIVVYPILDLDHFFTDIDKYLRTLEEAVILTLHHYGITAGRVKGLTGVWIDGENPAKARKICALGVRCSRWVTMHGLSFNVNTNLEYFNYIVPCGIQDKAVTSMEQELKKKVDIEETKSILLRNLIQLFDLSIL